MMLKLIVLSNLNYDYASLTVTLSIFDQKADNFS